MRTNITNSPHITAGEYITKKLTAHAQSEVLLLLSGGSSLDILPHIDTSIFNKKITITFVDERYTSDKNGNNFLQMQKMPFFAQTKERGAGTIETFQKNSENFDTFSKRIAGEFESYFEINTNVFILGVFGIGNDGHTAGIFPTTETVFKKIYRTEDLLISTSALTSNYPKRITVTPKFIEEHIDEVVLYATGHEKCQTVLKNLYNRELQEHEIPALIPSQHSQSILFTDCKDVTS